MYKMITSKKKIFLSSLKSKMEYLQLNFKQFKAQYAAFKALAYKVKLPLECQPTC